MQITLQCYKFRFSPLKAVEWNFIDKFVAYYCCIIMNDACDDVARVRDEREKIHQYRTKRENDRTLLSYVERIP